MFSMKLAYRAFQQSIRTRELRLLFVSLVLAVAVMSGIGLFVEALKSSLMSGSAELLGGDRQLHSTRDIDPHWLKKAEQMNLQVASAVSFPTMLMNGDEMVLVSARAVGDTFPLKGAIETSEPLFNETKNARSVPREVHLSGPSVGNMWLSDRLFTLLNIQAGDEVSIGNIQLRAEKVLQKEPDVRFGMSALSPRVLMNDVDMANSGVIQPGSRLFYTWYFTGEESSLEQYHRWLEPQLESWHQWRSIKEGRPSVASALDKSETYLYLAGGLSMLLAMTAILLSSRQFAISQVQQVGLMRALGLQQKTLAKIYLQLMSMIGLLGAIIGSMAGMIIFLVGHYLLADVFQMADLALASPSDYLSVAIKGVVTSLACVYVATLPLWSRLKKVSPMVILRSQSSSDGENTNAWASLPGLVVMGVLISWFVQDVKLSGALFGALALLYVVIAFIVIVGINGLQRVVSKTVKSNEYLTALHLAVSALEKYRWQTAFQIFSLGITLMVLISLILVRTELLDEWQAQLPENAPNHFLINIAEYDVQPVKDLLLENSVESSGIYPMVRGRLTHINGDSVKTVVTKEKNVGALNRELNLSWANEMPTGNVLESGAWWNEAGAATCNKCVSIESRLAEKLGLKLNDKLTVTIGSVPVEVGVASIRKVQWDSMKPNFYLLFTPGALDQFPATYITSFYLPPEQKSVLNNIGQQFPTVSILEIDKIIKRIEEIMARVSLAIEMLLVLVIIASLLVMLALINASLKERKQQVAIVRAIGGRRSVILKTQAFEFFLLGGAAAFVAYLGAELVVNLVLKILFSTEMSSHFSVGLPIAVAGMAMITVLGFAQVRSVLSTSPTRVLREI